MTFPVSILPSSCRLSDQAYLHRCWLSPPRQAFSLVEVVLALGIVSFGLLTTLGLMSVGLTTLHQAMQQTVETQIVQSINSQALLTSYTNLATVYSGTTFYYDDEGQYLTNSPSPPPAATHYCVTTSLGNPNYPGSGNFTSSALTNSMTALQIQIGVGVSPSSSHDLSTNVVQVPNSGG